MIISIICLFQSLELGIAAFSLPTRVKLSDAGSWFRVTELLPRGQDGGVRLGLLTSGYGLQTTEDKEGAGRAAKHVLSLGRLAVASRGTE